MESRIQSYDHLNSITPKHNKVCTQQTNRKHDTEWEKTENNYSKIRNETKVFIFTTLIQYILEILTRKFREKKEIKGILNRQKRLPAEMRQYN
jgi:hypothetical protein